MTNSEKYLKDGVEQRYFAMELYKFIINAIETCGKEEPNFLSLINTFLSLPAKPTLTEDERVILRNIVYDSEYKYIYRSLGMLYLSETEKLTSVDRLPAMHHLFQFIKERRRIPC